MADYRFPCPVAKKCGGCQLTNKEYKDQLSMKQAYCVKMLGKFCHVENIIGMDEPYHYRNKVQAAFGTTRSGMIISGVYQSGTHTIVKTDSCAIEDSKSDEIIVTIRRLLKEFHLGVFDENRQAGFLRHVLIRKAFGTGEIMVVLVTGTPVFKSKNNFCKALLKAHPEITTIVQNVNNKFTSLVLGDSQTVLYGDGYITDVLCGMKFRISPASFYQINYKQTNVLYSKALEFACLTGSETVVDAYAGVGTIGMIASPLAKRVISVELNPAAVKDAKINAKLNGIDNMSFFCADATEFLTQMAQENEHVDVVLMDPPRAGSTARFMTAVSELAPDRVVYVSCNPETLSRDLLFFAKKGYKAIKCQPVDMFPHTKHVETVVVLGRKEVVDISLSTEALGYTAKTQEKPSYNDIKDYVKENFSLNISNVDISNVKAKHNLMERKNYNIGNGKSRRPGTTPEKEQAIEEALRHFGMLDN